MTRFLMATTVAPFPPTTGGEYCSAALASGLAAAGDLTVVAYARPGQAPRPPPGVRLAVAQERPIESKSAPLRSAGWMAGALLARRPASVQKYVSRAFRRRFADALRDRPDVVVLDHAQMAWLLPLCPPGQPVVLVEHNVESDLYAGRPGRFPRSLVDARESRLMRTLERKAWRRCAMVWTLSEADRQRIASLDPSAAVRAIPVAPPEAPPAPAAPPRFDVGLIGTWTWPENEAGLRWFLDEVHPHLGGLTVGVAGRTRHVPTREGVAYLGFVPDSMAFLQGARCLAIPAVAGAGIQIKTIEAASLGQPVVATPVAVRGGYGFPDWVRVEEDPARFAQRLREAAGSAARWDASAWRRQRRAESAAALQAALAELVRP